MPFILFKDAKELPGPSSTNNFASSCFIVCNTSDHRAVCVITPISCFFIWLPLVVEVPLKLPTKGRPASAKG
ncbi:MAG: hypothetical protein A3F31_03470 [Candidatus Levybacteria bacterium RIFCSPHIGHO2_12_FULL_38_12]|nr:MAG: hypothetical protein A2770_03895 [Candidatus Levybacteria bacterium RIFCSPHIGHO2_01_FULL_38_12]OGH22158.1 MAG: hypothetical protein A3D75_02840 [Candidatus Levybacteria bacterium RIFCSPHIGHO2_02_FULL_37_18]OGH23005.1 MAG: hypothetical protein A3F31_03470 [Candidatus Levybacteria bacterium RIFCSPHIGHO2_12_FULL_38_12]OGH34177.1 MAG: hypothetical protein A3A47_03600 [Candidatus Levybacteria bacterium RIFCSPLOWO2_01_FULL_37_20]OGH44970.1 MAG: hypothetical protein A3J14_01270 [Candidatus Lev